MKSSLDGAAWIRRYGIDLRSAHGPDLLNAEEKAAFANWSSFVAAQLDQYVCRGYFEGSMQPPFPVLPFRSTSLPDLIHHYRRVREGFMMLHEAILAVGQEQLTHGFVRDGDQEIALSILHAASLSSEPVKIASVGDGQSAKIYGVGKNNGSPWLARIISTALGGKVDWTISDRNDDFDGSIERGIFNIRSLKQADFLELGKSFDIAGYDFVVARNLPPSIEDSFSGLTASIAEILKPTGTGIVCWDTANLEIRRRHALRVREGSKTVWLVNGRGSS